MRRLLTGLLCIALTLSLAIPAFARDTRYTDISQLTDEDYLQEDFADIYIKEYGHLFGVPDGKFTYYPDSAKSDTFPDDLQVLLPSGMYNPYFYPPTDQETLTLPKNLVILFGDFHKDNWNNKNLHYVNWNELTELRYIQGDFSATPLYTVDLRNTKVVRIGKGAFSYNPVLGEFYAPSTLRRIDDNAFLNCKDMSVLELNEGLEYIGANNFSNSLNASYMELRHTPIQIPSTVRYIGPGGLPVHVSKRNPDGTWTRIMVPYSVYKGSYAEEWCKTNGAKFVYTRDRYGNIIMPKYNPNDKAPEMTGAVQIGDLRFTNVVDWKANTTFLANPAKPDFMEEHVSSYFIKVTTGSCIQTTLNGTDMFSDYTDDLSTSDPDHMIRCHVRPYLTARSGSGYQAGLIWQLERNENAEDRNYSNVYEIKIRKADGSVDPVKYHVTVQDKWENITPKPPVPKPVIPEQPKVIQVTPNTSRVLVGGKPVTFEAYTINGHNYFKLRDVAKAVNGTPVQFGVNWVQSQHMIELSEGDPYIPVGGELVPGNGKPKNAICNEVPIFTTMGGLFRLNAYTINQNNFFKLRDLGNLLGFGVDWDGTTRTVIIDTSKNLLLG